MFGDIILSRTVNLCSDMLQVGWEETFVCRILWLHKPKCAKLRRKMFDNFGTHGNLDGLYSWEQQWLQLLIKVVAIHNFIKTTIWLELMCQAVGLHESPIVCQTEITDDVQNSFCLNLIINNQPSTFQYINLLWNCYSLLRVSNAHKQKCPAGYAVLMGSERDLSMQR